MAGGFSDAFRMVTELHRASKLADTLYRQVKLLEEASSKIKSEAEKTIDELTPKAGANAIVLNDAEEFKQCMQQVVNHSSIVSQHCQPVQAQCEKIHECFISDSDVTIKEVQEAIDELQKLRSTTQSLYKHFIGFLESFKEASDALRILRGHCATEAGKAEERATAIVVGGSIGSGVAGAGAVGLGLAGLLFPPLWIPAAVCGVAAVGGGIATGVDANKMTKLKESFQNFEAVFGSTAKELAKIGDEIRASVEATDNLLQRLESADRRARNLEREMWKANSEPGRTN